MLGMINAEISEKVDYAGYLIDNVLNNQANKYLEREEEFAKYPPKDNIVILPGSNKIKQIFV